MTVRILLGNLPEMVVFEPTTGIYRALHDLREAGVAEMENEEVAFRKSWIDATQLAGLAEPLMKTEYGRYLAELAGEGL